MTTNFSIDPNTAFEAKSIAQKIAFSPFVFQASLAARDLGLLEAVENSGDMGLNALEISEKTGVSSYGVKVLLDMGLSAGLVLLREERYVLAKVGYFMLHDPMTKVNFNFTKDVCYEALGSLEDSVKNGTPEGLKVFGDWETLYPFLGQLPPPAKKSWFDFDHYYSDQSFSEVLPLVMQCSPGLILDIGGNTGKWARLCVEQYSEVEVCVVDLPEQIVMLQEHMTGHEASSRVTGFPANMLDPDSKLPGNADVIWMSQFLDCFSEELIEKILLKCMSALPENGRLYIMETFWDKQPHEIGTLSVNATSLYFTAIANGCSRMYRQADMVKILDRTGFTVNREWDSIGVGHTLLECVKRGFVDNTA
jgi:ubiquinone/menaquinone biosynthesis C-methylase UbiE